MRTWLLCALTLVGCSGGFSTEPAQEQQDVEDSTGGARESGGESGSVASGGQEDPTGGNATGGDAPEPTTGGIRATGGDLATGGAGSTGGTGAAPSGGGPIELQCPGEVSVSPGPPLKVCADCSWAYVDQFQFVACSFEGESHGFCSDPEEELYCCCPAVSVGGCPRTRFNCDNDWANGCEYYCDESLDAPPGCSGCPAP